MAIASSGWQTCTSRCPHTFAHRPRSPRSGFAGGGTRASLTHSCTPASASAVGAGAGVAVVAAHAAGNASASVVAGAAAGVPARTPRVSGTHRCTTHAAHVRVRVHVRTARHMRWQARHSRCAAPAALAVAHASVPDSHGIRTAVLTEAVAAAAARAQACNAHSVPAAPSYHARRAHLGLAQFPPGSSALLGGETLTFHDAARCCLAARSRSAQRREDLPCCTAA